MKHEEEKKVKYPEFKELIESFCKEELKEIETSSIGKKTIKNKLKIIPTIIYDKNSKEIRLEINIGIDQMYRLKSILKFYDRFLKNDEYQYGKDLNFIHKEENVEEKSQELLKFLFRYAEAVKYAISGNYNRLKYLGKGINDDYILINPYRADEIFNILNGQKVELEVNNIKSHIEIIDKEPQIKFSLIKEYEDEYVLLPNLSLERCNIVKGRKYSYLLYDKKLYRCSKEYEKYQLKIISTLKENFQTKLRFSKDEFKNFFSLIFPKIEKNILLEENEELSKYIPKLLKVKIYIDSDNDKNIIVNIRFCYKNTEINPFKDKPNIPRDVIKEANILNDFYQTGFMIDNNIGHLILIEEEKIYKFLTQDLEEYKKYYEVFVDQDFKQKLIKAPKIMKLGVKVENNLLELDLQQLNIDKLEIKEILKQYQLKKKYYRFKDGTFLDFNDNADIIFLDNIISNMEISYKQLQEDIIRLPIYRSYYLNNLLNGLSDVNIIKEDSYTNIVSKKINKEIELPCSMNEILRDYQKIGFKWLKAIEYYKFGGILADDMGLGKTIQILSILKEYVENNDKLKRNTSIVVSPSSLCLNWYNEVQRFAPNIKTIVISGNIDERNKQIDEIQMYDLVIISYDLLRRDYELIHNKKYQFQYIIADEAQYIKNSNTKNSKVIKSIKGNKK